MSASQRERGLSASVPLPSPHVRLARDYLARVERLVPRVRAARERREGPGKSGLTGGGLEFHGYRPYRSGESLGGIDWTLYARLDRPFVRLARREASEHWAVLLDASASMGTGVPGKLQLAAEVTGALASLALAQGTTVQVLSSTADGDLAEVVARKPTDLPKIIAFLTGLTAAGGAGLARLAQERARFRAAGRVIALGDLVDLEPADLFTLGRRGRELACAQVLAREELQAVRPGGGDESVVWVDAETGERVALRLPRALCEAYEAEVGRWMAAWQAACARHRAAFGSWTSDAAFEDVCVALVGR